MVRTQLPGPPDDPQEGAVPRKSSSEASRDRMRAMLDELARQQDRAVAHLSTMCGFLAEAEAKGWTAEHQKIARESVDSAEAGVTEAEDALRGAHRIAAPFLATGGPHAR